MKFVLLALTTLAVVALPALGQDPQKVPSDINKPFADPKADEYVKKFETESREVYKHREAIVAGLRLKPGMSVADLGAGTGLFTRLIAEKVGRAGSVSAVDIAPAFLEHIARESKRLDQPQVKTVRGTQTSTGLPAASVDLVFVCDVYHHVEEPAKWLASVHDTLKPNGRLVVIEFDRDKAKVDSFVKTHVRAGKDVFVREIEAAGFRREVPTSVPNLQENAFLLFRKIETGETGIKK